MPGFATRFVVYKQSGRAIHVVPERARKHQQRLDRNRTELQTSVEKKHTPR